jgi:hypothetical protein
VVLNVAFRVATSTTTTTTTIIRDSNLEDIVNVEDEVEDVERKPGEREDDDDGDQEGVGSSLTLQFVLKSTVLLLNL